MRRSYIAAPPKTEILPDRLPSVDTRQRGAEVDRRLLDGLPCWAIETLYWDHVTIRKELGGEGGEAEGEIKTDLHAASGTSHHTEPLWNRVAAAPRISSTRPVDGTERRSELADRCPDITAGAGAPGHSAP